MVVSLTEVDTQALVRVDGVSQVFDQGRTTVTALRDLSIDVDDGEFVAIVGPSGCGKTTVLRIMAGLVRPTVGTVRRRSDIERAGGVGMVFQNPTLLPWRSVLKNVLLPSEVLRTRDSRARALELLTTVGLEGFENALPHELSGGMQQRVAICRALLTDPPLLLMDEPFGALDAITRERLNQQLQELWMTTEKTVVLVTHNIEEATFLADRIVVMTSRPGAVGAIIVNELPRPRDLHTYEAPMFGRYGARIRELIGGDGESFRG